MSALQILFCYQSCSQQYGQYPNEPAVETCRLTVPDDVSEIEVAEIFKKTHEDKDVYVKNKDGYFRNFRSM